MKSNVAEESESYANPTNQQTAKSKTQDQIPLPIPHEHWQGIRMDFVLGTQETS